MYTIDELKIRLLSELKEIAESLNVKNYKKLAKQDLIYAILDQQAITPEDQLPTKKGEQPPQGAEVKEEKPKAKKRPKKSEKAEGEEDKAEKPQRRKRENVKETSEAAVETKVEGTKPEGKKKTAMVVMKR